MTKRGCNLMSDGRPIIGLTSIQVAELALSIEPKALIIPAHAWTPWFSVYGSLGGFDSLEEAFGPFAKNIYAIETGLSSDPAMNWRIKELDHRSILSSSDAHSGPKIGREATVFELSELSYENIYKVIAEDPATLASRQTPRIAFTIEFHPEEGKYHYTGHRLCNVRLTPEETKKKGAICSVCGKPLTQGVMQRVEELAGRSEADLQMTNVKFPMSNGNIVDMKASKAFPNRPPYVMLVPLQEIISESIGSPVTSPKVQVIYQKLTDELGGEFNVLLAASISELTKSAGERIAQGIDKVRRGDIVIDPGYDGVFGVVKIWKEGEEKPLLDSSKEQLTMF
jgi:PHP family Zn ribbon phosphoesterase